MSYIEKYQSEVQFQFTRHLLSCNNIDYGKSLFWGKDKEPGGTFYGILENIYYATLPEQKPYFSFNHIYVSNLYRTWITAFLLYGSNIGKEETLTLYISPYLKEYHGYFKTGNFPKQINHMVSKFLNFLHKLYDIWKKNGITTIQYTNLPKKLVLKLPPTSPELILSKSQEIIYEKEKGNDESRYIIKQFCNTQDTIGPKSQEEFILTGDLQKFMEWYNSDNNYYGKNEENRNKDWYKSDNNYYGKNEENRNKDWYKSDDDKSSAEATPSGDSTPTSNSVRNLKVVHIVTHSHIMRSYLSRFKVSLNGNTIPFDIDKIQDTELQLIRNSNCWHFITSQNNPININYTKQTLIEPLDLGQGIYTKQILIESLDLGQGIPINKKTAKNNEIFAASHELSLCGKAGRVKDIDSNICEYTDVNRLTDLGILPEFQKWLYGQLAYNSYKFKSALEQEYGKENVPTMRKAFGIEAKLGGKKSRKKRYNKLKMSIKKKNTNLYKLTLN